MDGARVMKDAGGSGKKKLWIAAGVVIGVLLCAYLGLCAWVGASDRIMPNVSAAGVPLGGLTAQQAQQSLEQRLNEAGGLVQVELRYGHWTGALPGAAAQLSGGQDAAGVLAWQAGRSNFLTQGGAYLGHLLGVSTEIELPLELSPQGEQQLSALLDQADQKVGGSVTNAQYGVEGDRLLLTKGITGVAIERGQAAQLVLEQLSGALAAQMAGGQGEPAAVELPAQQTAPQQPDFDAIHQELYRQAQDATVDPATYQVQAHVVGVDFDVDQAKRAFDQASEGETVAVPLILTQPSETKQSLESKLFADLLGEATSKVGGSANRKFNVKLSAQACNGMILMPGEVFSYNTATGSRSADKGYLPAPVYVGGKSEDEVGGGICQTSSTIYNAVLYSRLKIVERKNHMYAVGYVPDGMDATVYYGSTDFRFENDTGYPVKIVTSSYDSGGSRYLSVKLYGTKTDDVTVKLDRVQFDWVQPGVKYAPDETVPRGTTRVDTKQNPYTGRKATVYRYLYDKDGNLIEKENMGTSTYKSRDKLVYYNPLDGDPATWVNGVPPTPSTTPDPGTVTDPGATTDPGTATDPGTTTDPGVTPNPGSDPDAAGDDKQQTGDNSAGGASQGGQEQSGGQTPAGEQTPAGDGASQDVPPAPQDGAQDGQAA